ncbi:MAG: hypothetical protein ACNA71_06960 [Kiritimatiellia bacterium]
MLTCKQVSKALAEQDYKDMSWPKRMLLRFHVAICAVCKGYNGNVMLFQDMARAFRRVEETTEEAHAPENAKNKWAECIHAASGKTDDEPAVKAPDAQSANP